MLHGASMAYGPWPIHGPGAWCMVDPWPMVHLQSMVHGEDATMLKLIYFKYNVNIIHIVMDSPVIVSMNLNINI